MRFCVARRDASAGMHRRYLLTPEAKRDVAEIWEYSAERWNAAQANRHITLMKASIEVATFGKLPVRPCSEIRPGYFKFLAGSHVIFCTQTKKTLTVVRILHQRMDFGRHL